MVCCAVGYLDNTASPAEGIHCGMKCVLSAESDGGGSGRSSFHGTSTTATPPPQRCLHLVAVVGLVRLYDPAVI
jgi:hypothetical protein